MSNNQNGFLYEQTVLESIKKSGLTGNITEAAGASSAAGDADFRINDQAHLVEIKLNKNAQMGGTSVRYSQGCQNLQLINSVEPEVVEMVYQAIQERTHDLDQLLTFMASEWDPGISAFPFRSSKEVWVKAQNEGLLVNSKIKTDVSFIARHYAEKNVNYIQIGKCGLFHLGNNPANLPVPQLKGTVNLEIRTGRSGSQLVKSLGCRVVTGAIRVQARLKTKNKSPYTLDEPQSIAKMLL